RSRGPPCVRLVPYTTLFRSTELSTLSQKQFRPWRRRVQIVFQDPFGSLSPRMSVEQIIREGLEIHDHDNTADHQNKVIQALRDRSEEHTSELQSRENLVCRL